MSTTIPAVAPSAAAPASIHIPTDLLGIVVGVFGLDNRPQAQPRFRVRRPKAAQPDRRRNHGQHPVHAASDRPAL